MGMLTSHCRGILLPTEDKVWTIVSHDLQMQTTVVGYSPEKYSVTQLLYSASMEQISAITSSAEYCEQYVSYFCKMSRLLNTPGRLSTGCYCYLLSQRALGVTWAIREVGRVISGLSGKSRQP